MSRSKPYTSNVTSLGKSEPSTCSECRFWKQAGEVLGSAVGRCVAAPPSHVTAATQYGPLVMYSLTTADTPACGRAESK